MPQSETGHQPNRHYADRDGNVHLNGSSIYTDESGTAVSGAELAVLDVTAGAAAASKALVLDANAELNDVGVLKVADKIITTGELLALNATPITLVAAPGAGKYLHLVAAYLFLDFATTAYDGIAAGEDLTIKYTNGSGTTASTIEATGFLDAAADALAIAAPTSGVVAVANAALVLHMLTGEIATGDSPLKVRTIYREVRTAELAAIA